MIIMAKVTRDDVFPALLGLIAASCSIALIYHYAMQAIG